MALKDKWVDRRNGEDFVLSEDINEVARAVIEIEQAKENGEFKGDKGDPFTYEDFTAAQLNTLKSEITSDVLAALPTWEGGSY